MCGQMRRSLRVAALLIATVARHSGAQSVVDRTPNLDDGWTVPPGVVQFNFVHRFDASAPPARKLTNFTNFRLATGVPFAANVGLDYASNSTVFTGIPNEYQLSLRRPIVWERRGAPLDATLTGAYNFASQSVDGELSLGRHVGPVRLLGMVRGISDGYDVQRSLWGVGGGAVVRITNWLSVGGDVFDLVNVHESQTAAPAWGAAAELRIPYSPHSLSIQLANTQSATIEGSSRGVKGQTLVGFEFTIPVTLARYFGRRSRPAADTAAARTVEAGAVPVVRMVNLSFRGGNVRVPAGTRVRWVNGDQVQHTVTADDGSFESGLLDPNAVYDHAFERPGTYKYHCTPHPFMTGVVVVE